MPDPPGWDAPTTSREIEGWVNNGHYCEFIRWSVMQVEGDPVRSVAIAMRDKDNRIVYTLLPAETFRMLAQRILPQLKV
jgi:hypothetical protein